jgi:ribulose-5-phosphate 4-epimerase/fuculose-1-phosphate aldolase
MADRSSLEAAKAEAAIGNRILAEVGLAAGVRASLGHVSMRVPGDLNLFVVKGRGYRMDVLSRMRPEDMVVCELEGRWIDGPPYSLQCSEVKIHSCIYKNRPDVVSVVHVHPDYVVLMSVLQNGFKPMAQEGARLVTKPLPVYPHTKIITSEEEGQEVAHLLGNGEAWLHQGDLRPATWEVQCPLHQGRFDLRTGHPTAWPSSEPVQVYAVRVEGEDILVGLPA